MTNDRVLVDDLAALRDVLSESEALLLDFDGPVCSVFAGFPASVVAEQLREILLQGEHAHLPPEIQKSDDPFDIFSFAATLGSSEALYIEAALRAHEVEAIASAEPTLGAHDFVHTWHASGRKLAIVSNNSTAAVEAYLQLHRLASYVHYVSARTVPDPLLLKPNPHLLLQASEALNTEVSKCALIGDSLTDIHAAQNANTSVIGYANKPGKSALFAAERPQAIITNMRIMLSILPSS